VNSVIGLAQKTVHLERPRSEREADFVGYIKKGAAPANCPYFRSALASSI
jgi:hypothetical protein